MADNRGRFSVGQLVHHRLFDYRGVVYDVDPTYQGTEEWYEQMARSRPPKDRPWYHVLVHDAPHATYVAERNLAPDEDGESVRHPDIEIWFEGFRDGAHVPRPGPQRRPRHLCRGTESRTRRQRRSGQARPDRRDVFRFRRRRLPVSRPDELKFELAPAKSLRRG